MELDELSGRTTGRLGYTWPTTAYAIGGTATLALRYSIIPAAGVHRGEQTTGPRDLRERADASVRRPGLGARLLAMSDEARVGCDLQFPQRFFLSDNQRVAVLDWRIRTA